jgi:putative DNA primase/helicase
MNARLADLGILVRRPDQPGQRRAPCPQCGRGTRDDTLAVKLEPDGGATWICHRCGLRGGFGPEGGIKRHASQPPARQDRRPEPERHETLSAWARELWGACRPILPGTVAAAYLTGRHCALPPWPSASDLRWHPHLRHKSGHVGPALVALVTDIETCEPISLHRTWIKPDGSGKAELDQPRLLLKGHRSDGVIRLWPHAEVTSGLVLGEGIETCLAAASAGLIPVWSTISAGNLKRFPILSGLEGLTILVDYDRPNPKTGERAGIEAALQLIERYAAAGFDRVRDIKLIVPQVEGEDVADLVRLVREAA